MYNSKGCMKEKVKCMIPKKIHYCWFGGNPIPESVTKYIESWKKFCPEYEIKEWNETNFDVNCCLYSKEAYAEKKWAFVSDVARLYALVSEGGIYMDTDVEVCKKLDCFLYHKAFSGFEAEDLVSTGIMACEKGYPLFSKLLEEYKERRFINPDGSYNAITNVEYITNMCGKFGLKFNNLYQEILGLSIYPKEYFSPKDYMTGKILKTENTYTIHYFASSWYTEREKKWHVICQKILNRYGQEKWEKIRRNILWKLIAGVYRYGWINTAKKIVKRISG